VHVSDAELRALDAISSVPGASALSLTVEAKSVWYQPAEVVVRVVSQRDAPDLAEAALRDLVAYVRQVPPEDVRLGRRCPQCAAPDHGRRVVAPISGSPVHVSMSRTSGRTLVAVTSAGPLGVDIERLDPRRFQGVAAVALHPDEGRPGLPDLAARWARKEAVLKATGWGLNWAPSLLDVTSPHGGPFALTAFRDGRGVPLWVSDVSVEAGYAAAVGVVSRVPVNVRMAP
jgi:4'-phosphopantetheinyl transferase